MTSVEEPVFTAPDDGATLPRRLRDVRLAMVIAVVPLIVSAVALLVGQRDRYQPAGDFATIELQIRDVFRHPVLIGLFSREEWHHPGPALYYVLVGPYRWFGSSGAAVDVGALLVNGAAVVAMAWLARRHGGTALMLCTLVGTSAVIHALGADFLRSPWNPSITVLPFGVMLLLCWCACCGDTWALPAAAGVASFLVQTHVGYVPLTLPFLVVSAATMVWSAWLDDGEQRAVVRSFSVTAAVVFVLWLPPIIDQIANSPGNLRRVIEYFTNPENKPHPLAQGWRIVTGEFALRPEWLYGQASVGITMGEHPYALSAPAPWLAVPFVGVAVFLARRGSAAARWLVVTLLVAIVAGIFSVTRTVGLLSAYRLQWTWVIAMLAMVVVVWTVWTQLTERWPWVHSRVLVPAAIAGLVAFTVPNTVDALRAGTPVPALNKAMRPLNTQLLAQIPAGPGVVLVRHADDTLWRPGVVLALERHGIPVRVDTDRLHLLGDHRLYRGEPIRAVVTIVDGNVPIATPAGTRLVAYRGCSPEQVERERPVLASLDAEYKRGGLSATDYKARRKNLCDSYAIAIFLGSS